MNLRMKTFNTVERMRLCFLINMPRWALMNEYETLFNMDEMIRYSCLVIGDWFLAGRRSHLLKGIIHHGNLNQAYLATCRALCHRCLTDQDNYENDMDKVANLAMDLIPHLNYDRQIAIACAIAEADLFHQFSLSTKIRFEYMLSCLEHYDSRLYGIGQRIQFIILVNPKQNLHSNFFSFKPTN